MAESSAMRLRRAALFGGKKSFEEETVGGQTRHHQGGEHGRSARHRNHLDVLREGLTDKFESGIGNQRGAGIRNQSQTPRLRPAGQGDAAA